MDISNTLLNLKSTLTQKQQTLATAESCTGGLISEIITSISGASDFFWGGFVSYDNIIKEKVLGVKRDHLINFGAVSEQVAKEMAEGARRVCKTDWAISTTGIAGPTGGTPDKPVGTVYFGISGPNGTKCIKKIFIKKNRDKVRKASAEFILEELLNELK